MMFELQVQMPEGSWHPYEWFPDPIKAGEFAVGSDLLHGTPFVAFRVEEAAADPVLKRFYTSWGSPSCVLRTFEGKPWIFRHVREGYYSPYRAATEADLEALAESVAAPGLEGVPVYAPGVKP